ncbi:hypothetical protein BJ508DRAFT_417164 [Ascobolus immersus RN42]|uniref:Uncharacterized protein n=1 Tax=Ascobolus immersus RN42 TaxID=1160509 RepID=A0A3N4HU05_ASCIM|nr:hypothetical protein BJ508DRAFT_417164 [Ascobolus immersus RN42]
MEGQWDERTDENMQATLLSPGYRLKDNYLADISTNVKTSYFKEDLTNISVETTEFLSPTTPNGSKPSKKLNLKSWPRKAKALKRDWGGFFLDVGRILIVIALMAFGAAAYMSNGKPVTDPKARMIKEASRWFTSVFPIAYTALMVKTLRDIALALLVRGTHLMTVEQLLQNSSVGATVITGMKFRGIHVIPLVLFFVWAFSPLGGQGALRLLDTVDQVDSERNGVAYYVLPNATTIFHNNTARRGDLSRYLAVNHLFISSMVSSTRPDRDAMRRDNLGHVRIPRLSTLTKKPDRDGWVSVSTADDVWDDGFQYSSFLGLPTVTNSSSSRNTFTIHNSYFEFKCSEKRWISSVQHPEISENPKEKHFPDNERYLAAMQSKVVKESSDGTNKDVRSMLNVGILPNQAEYSIKDLESGHVKRKEPLSVGIRVRHHPHTFPKTEEDKIKWGAAYGTILQYNCTLTEPRVEVAINCTPNAKAERANTRRVENGLTAGICEVTAMRSDPRYRNVEDTYTTQFDTADGDILRDALFARIASAARYDEYELTRNQYETIPALIYLHNPENMMGWHVEADGTASEDMDLLTYENMDFWNIEPEEMEKRFNMFFNGFFHASQVPFIRSRGIPVNRTRTDRWKATNAITTEELELEAKTDISETGTSREALEVGRNNLGITENTSTTITEVYRINYSWLAVYMCSCIVLFISVISGFSFHMRYTFRTAAPDILTYFSSLTRDNPHMRIPEDSTGFAGSSMDGAKRSKKLGHVEVRLGDVRPNDVEGHIALFREDLYEGIPMLGEGKNRSRKYR